MKKKNKQQKQSLAHTRKTVGSDWEIRLHPDGSFDEFVGTAFIHIEQMSETHFWMGIYNDKRERIVINFFVDKKKRKLSAEYQIENPGLQVRTIRLRKDSLEYMEEPRQPGF